jgi:hypothetical protein
MIFWSRTHAFARSRRIFRKPMNASVNKNLKNNVISLKRTKARPYFVFGKPAVFRDSETVIALSTFALLRDSETVIALSIFALLTATVLVFLSHIKLTILLSLHAFIWQQYLVVCVQSGQPFKLGFEHPAAPSKPMSDGASSQVIHIILCFAHITRALFLCRTLF